MSIYDRRDRCDWSTDEMEAYAAALHDIRLAIGIQDGHCKTYDPLTIEGGVYHSYVFDLWDGGRHHHPEGRTQEQVRKAILDEVVEELKAYKNGEYDWEDK